MWGSVLIEKRFYQLHCPLVHYILQAETTIVVRGIVAQLVDVPSQNERQH